MAPRNLSNSSPVVTSNAVLQDQPSPTFLATIANAMKQVLLAKQASSLPVSNSLVSVSMASISRGVLAQPTSLSLLDSQALSLAASGTEFLSFPPVTATTSAQGRPNLVVPTFVSTFSPPTPLLVS